MKYILTLLLALSLEATVKERHCNLCKNYQMHLNKCKYEHKEAIKVEGSIKEKTYKYYKKLVDSYCKCSSEEGK